MFRRQVRGLFEAQSDINEEIFYYIHKLEDRIESLEKSSENKVNEEEE